jgi:hypothetical protein
MLCSPFTATGNSRVTFHCLSVEAETSSFKGMTTFQTARLTTLIVSGFLCLTALSAGAQSFTEVAPGLPNSAQLCVAWGDYDGDGLIDVLVAGSGSHDIPFTTLYHNNGNGTFVDSGIVLQGLSRANAAWGDFDGDGKLDLAMTGVDVNGLPTTRVYRNNGNSFTAVSDNFTGVFAGIAPTCKPGRPRRW